MTKSLTDIIINSTRKALSLFAHFVVLFANALLSYILVNPLMGTGKYSATSNNIKLVHWLLMGGLLHLVQR